MYSVANSIVRDFTLLLDAFHTVVEENYKSKPPYRICLTVCESREAAHLSEPKLLRCRRHAEPELHLPTGAIFLLHLASCAGWGNPPNLKLHSASLQNWNPTRWMQRDRRDGNTAVVGFTGFKISSGSQVADTAHLSVHRFVGDRKENKSPFWTNSSKIVDNLRLARGDYETMRQLRGSLTMTIIHKKDEIYIVGLTYRTGSGYNGVEAEHGYRYCIAHNAWNRALLQHQDNARQLSQLKDNARQLSQLKDNARQLSQLKDNA
ncbi:hypothetical protein LXL04_039699 [Taraxacum kok-saghyz]